MAFVMSPSNMATFRLCPLRFYGQNIAKDMVYKETPARKRGIDVHEAVEKYISGDTDALPSDINTVYTRSMVRKMDDLGGRVFVERELAVTRDLKPTGFWADDAWLRARADVVVEHGDEATIIDLKTGKKWDEDNFQVRVEAMMMVAIARTPVVNYEYWYLDTGETVRGVVDFRGGLRPVSDIIALMRNMEKAVADSNYRPKKNRFCKWCDYFDDRSKCNI